MADYTDIMDGGIINGGANDLSYTATIENSGGIVVSCLSDLNYIAYTSFDGGVNVSNFSDVLSFYDPIIFGSLSITGTSDINVIYELTESSLGGIQSSGESIVFSGYIPSGGIVTNVYSEIQIIYGDLTSGAVQLSGDSLIDVIYANIDFQGGIHFGGESISSVIVMMQGGVIVSGTHDLSILYVTRGGFNGGGLANVSSYVNEPVKGIVSGGAKTTGLAISTLERASANSATGEIFIGGRASAGISSVFIESKGGISIENTEPVKALVKFNLNFNFNWQVNNTVSKDIRFLWGLGQLNIYWYRVVGKGTTSNCLPQDPCCQKFILNVHARSLSELCQKLSQRRYKFPIESVQRFSRPAENSVIASEEANGTNHDCNNLIDVEVCDIPDCADFCVQQDLTLNLGFNMSVQVDAFKAHEAEGSVFVRGSSDVVATLNFPQFFAQGTGGLNISGDSVSSPNSFIGMGKAKLGGSAFTQFSRFSFVGGVFPNQTGLVSAKETQSILQNFDEQIWSLTERISTDNGSYTSSDISYGKTSQLLIARNFDFKFPSWAKIRSLEINIDRFATNTSVRDKEFYLIRGGEQISLNFATTNTDWPLLETLKVYKLNALNNPTVDGYAEEITKEILEDPTFGVAFKARCTSPSLIAVARIDFININAIYEDEFGSLIRISSQGALTRSQSYNFESNGKIILSGATSFAAKKIYKQRIISSGVRSGGKVEFVEDFVASGGLAVPILEAKVNPIVENPSGGLLVKFIEATVKPEWHTMTGGLSMDGTAIVDANVNVATEVNILASGTALASSDQFIHSSTGGFVIGGSSRFRTPNRRFFSEGNVIFLGGTSEVRGGNFVLEKENIGFNMSVLDLSATFLSDVDLNDLTGLTDNLNRCGCYNLPLKIQLYHNFAVDNNFAKFLVRNGLSISRTLDMNYNRPNDSWQSNLHYKGISSDNNTYETWDITIELNCTNSVGSIILGSSVWRLALQFVRKNLTTRETFDTRIFVAVMPDAICTGIASLLDFLIEYDTQSKICVVTPNATIYQSMVYDNIGLFKTPAWIDTPVLQLKVSQSSSNSPQVRYNLTNAVFA